jgi:hypothetical protein
MGSFSKTVELTIQPIIKWLPHLIVLGMQSLVSLYGLLIHLI